MVNQPDIQDLEKKIKKLEDDNLKLKRISTTLRQKNADLRAETVRDPLTGLYNQRFYRNNISKIVATAQRDKYDLGVLILDLKDLKYLNENFGHLSGDRMIKMLANIISSSVSSQDYAVRRGEASDEFLVLLKGAKHETGALLIDRINEKVAKFNKYNTLTKTETGSPSLEYQLGFTAGYVLWSYAQGLPFQTAFEQADKNMCEEKKKKISKPRGIY